MRTVYLLLISLLSSSAYAHTSLLPHFETESELLHALLHTSIAIVLVAGLYLLIRKLCAPKRVNLKQRHRN